MNSKQPSKLPDTIDLPPQAPIAACTGITLKSSDGSVVAARTVEWAESVMNTMYVVVPRDQELQSFTPSGGDGMKFTTKHGFFGLSVEQKESMKKACLPDCSIFLITGSILPMIPLKRRKVWQTSNWYLMY